ncbi:Nucleotidyl transferase [Carpediemonas membranifera]|uniref:Nucleotidyl transferase n=1 Tax=Carpediemonas membranifera TaxID=201153 RepID=A0A8J6E9Q5_9EUKA|nr:Nucleotidyl transferase [Carpediemonas membranifera]|eukprot:KAG9393670.1 Nucleotidyl transferase [Carpediemonas membranifera]
MAPPALIFLAGSGTRLRPHLEKPVAHKSLVPLPDGSTITSRQIKQLHTLREEGLISDIHVVLGNAAEAMEAYIRELETGLTVHMNEQHATTNTAASARIGLQEMTEETVVCMDGDVVMDIDILRQTARDAECNVSVLRPEAGLDDECVKCDYNASTGRIHHLGKGIEGQAEAIGVYKVPRAAIVELLCGEGLANKYFDDVLSIYAERGGALKAIDITGLQVTEVDELADYQLAQAIVSAGTP